MGQVPRVYHRDFAIPGSRRSRMASGSIGHVPASTFAELLSGPMIDIYVGESRRHWALHRNLLCHHSEALENELLGDAHGNTRKDCLDLPEYDPAGFELLVKWLYQGTLDDVSDMADDNQKYDYAVSCHKLYMLCERFDMTQLKNVAMDQYRKGLNEAQLVPDADEIDAIYRKSSTGSPFRRLMTSIAARQIMDPANERDIETYRECFTNNPDFAIDLVKAIRSGTGGMLLDDPTDKGKECLYHDHQVGPNCYTKEKPKGKQAQKSAGHSSPKSVPYISSDRQSRPRLRHPQTKPPPPPPPPSRPRERNLLRRCLTSPVSSTVGTSREMAVATPPLNHDVARDRDRDMERLRRVSPPDKRHLERTLANKMKMYEPHPALDEHHQSLEEMHHQVRDIPAAHGLEGEGEGGPVQSMQQMSSRRGIWEWASGRPSMLNAVGQTLPSEWRGLARPYDPMTNRTSNIFTIPETRDDFSIPSSTTSEKTAVHQQSMASMIDESELIQTHITASPSFSQTKRSSDDLVAASSNVTTPAHVDHLAEQWTNGKKDMPYRAYKNSSPPVPETPTPLQRRRDTPIEDDDVPTKDAPASESSECAEGSSNAAPLSPTPQKTSDTPPVRKFKVTLTPKMLSPARTSTSVTK